MSKLSRHSAFGNISAAGGAFYSGLSFKQPVVCPASPQPLYDRLSDCLLRPGLSSEIFISEAANG